ncbi:beta-lactamase family protein [Candidatus Binatia bacterium]|nr:beta-lactamase family protein [Candidatus Binatia bacterium]
MTSLYPLCRVPRSLDDVTTVRPRTEIEPRHLRLDRGAVDAVWDAVRSLYASGTHPAVALCVRYQGEVVLDRAIGYARGNAPDDAPDAPKVLATPDTPFCLLSASKPVTAMVVHLLDERRLVHLDDPVAEYIPEFARHGKETITLRHILGHRAGVPNPPESTMDPDLLENPDQIVELLCDQKPIWRPGQRLAYHAVTTGFLLAEVVRRVTGQDIRTFLRENILAPLGFRWMNYGVAREDIGQVAVNAFTGPPPLPPISTLFRRALGMPVEDVVEVSNDPRFLRSVFPSGNVISTATEASRFFDLLRCGGVLDGVHVFEPRTVRRAIAEQSYMEPDFTLVLPFRYSLGFMLGAEWFSLYGPYTARAFGHIGFTNVFCWADPDRDVAGALLTSGKPLVYPQIYWIWEMLRRIGNAFPVRPDR